MELEKVIFGGFKTKLEVGCGSGKTYKFNPRICPKCDVIGDIETPHKDLRNHYNFFIRFDAHYLPFKNNIFEEVFLSHVLEHLSDPSKALKEVHRVLANGGKIHVWVPNFMDRNAKLDKTHKHVFNFLTLRRLLKNCGFSSYYVIPVGSHIFFLKRLVYYSLLLIGAELYIVGRKKVDGLFRG